jgi:hypothetical protein
MRIVRRSRFASGLLLLGLGLGTWGVDARAQSTPPPPEPQAPPPPLDGPATGVEALPSTEAPPLTEALPSAAVPRAGSAVGTESPRGPRREDPPVAVAASPTGAGQLHLSQAPPPPIVERPSGRRPHPRARWIPGYWDWDRSRSSFVWVAGSWRIPPAGSIWIPARWMRDADGWYLVPGSWSRRRDPAAVAAAEPAWRRTGPPADHPDDTEPAAPGPDYFYVPGHYAPAGDQLTWRSGFWARVQPGWDWIPARWVRRSDGWEFREGSWARDPATAIGATTARRRVAARPGLLGRPPAIVESEPGPAVDGAGEADLPPPPGSLPEDDPIAGAEASGWPGGRVARVLPGDVPVIVGPVTGMPYYVIRPPGSYPYGPGGVVVPGAVPPFVRRLLDRVLP